MGIHFCNHIEIEVTRTFQYFDLSLLNIIIVGMNQKDFFFFYYLCWHFGSFDNITGFSVMFCAKHILHLDIPMYSAVIK